MRLAHRFVRQVRQRPCEPLLVHNGSPERRQRGDRRMKAMNAVAGAIACLLGACTGKLVVDDTGPNGIPVRSSQPYVQFYELTTHSKLGSACTHTKMFRHVNLPTGEVRYLNVEPAAFG